VLDDFGRKAIAAIADFDHLGWYGYRSVTARARRRRDKATEGHYRRVGIGFASGHQYGGLVTRRSNASARPSLPNECQSASASARFGHLDSDDLAA
jgi:hypothetical protein